MNRITHLFALILVFGAGRNVAAQSFEPLPDLGFGGFASDVNREGTIVGGVTLDETHELAPAIWTARNSVPQTLSTNGFGGYAVAANNVGVVVGARFIAVGSGSVPMAWINGEPVELPTLGEGGRALDVNDAGTIVGYVNLDGGLRPAMWQNGVLTVLPIPAFGDTGDILNATANSINEAGQIVGSIKIAFGSASRSLKWTDGIVETAALPEWDETRALKISEVGDVLVSGYFTLNGSLGVGILRASGDASILPSPVEYLPVYGTSFNGSGTVVGYTNKVDELGWGLQPLVWKDGQPEELELPAGARWGFPIQIADDGLVVGHVSDGVSGTSTAGVWETAPAETIQAENQEGLPGSVVELRASVAKGTSPMPGKSVEFQIKRKTVGFSTTNASGRALLNYTIPANATPGKHEIMASLGGSRYSLASLTVGWISTAMAANPASGKPNSTIRVTGRLTNAHNGKALSGQPIRIVYGGKMTQGKTSATGTYSVPFVVPATSKSGRSFKITVQFPGNTNHRSTRAVTSINVQ